MDAGFQRASQLVHPLGGEAIPRPPKPARGEPSANSPGGAQPASGGGFLQTLTEWTKQLMGFDTRTWIYGLGICSTLYFAYHLWPSRTPSRKKRTGSRRPSTATRSRTISRGSFPPSPVPWGYMSDSLSDEESDYDPAPLRPVFNTDPNYTPNSPFKKHRNLDRLVKSKDSQFYALYNYVGARGGAGDVITIPASSPPRGHHHHHHGGAGVEPGAALAMEHQPGAPRVPPSAAAAEAGTDPPPAQPGGGQAPSNVMREIPPNMPAQPLVKMQASSSSFHEPGATHPPAYHANQKSTLERLKERYRNGELPATLMRQTSLQNSFEKITRRMRRGSGGEPGSAENTVDMPFLPPLPDELDDSKLDIG